MQQFGNSWQNSVSGIRLFSRVNSNPQILVKFTSQIPISRFKYGYQMLSMCQSILHLKLVSKLKTGAIFSLMDFCEDFLEDFWWTDSMKEYHGGILAANCGLGWISLAAL